MAQSKQDWQLARDLVNRVNGSDLHEVCERPGKEKTPDFTFLDSDGSLCALELTRLLLPPTQDPDLVKFKKAVTDHPDYPAQWLSSVWIDRPDRLPTEDTSDYGNMVQQVVVMINLDVSMACTNPPNGPEVLYVAVSKEGSGGTEVASGTPWDLIRPDLLSSKNCQLEWGRRQGMRGILLLQVGLHDSEPAARRLRDQLNGRDYPNIDEAWVAFPDKPSSRPCVLKRAWARTRKR